MSDSKKQKVNCPHCNGAFRLTPSVFADVAISYPCMGARHESGYMVCAACWNQQRMKTLENGIYECRKCGQLWMYPDED